jgi:hypothetical protein
MPPVPLGGLHALPHLMLLSCLLLLLPSLLLLLMSLLLMQVLGVC